MKVINSTLLFIFFFASAIFSQNVPLIRVGIFLNQDKVKIDNVEIQDISSDVMRIYPQNNNFIKVEGRYYRGVIEIRKNKQKKLDVINELSIEEYLYGIMKMEISPAWHKDAIKAQAVASRTYALANLGKNKNSNFDIRGDILDQVYGGVAGEDMRSNIAVDETFGEVLMYNGEIAKIAFHSDSGGITEASRNVWGKEDVPYLQKVVENFLVASPYSKWVLELKREEVESLLFRNNVIKSRLRSISISEVSPSHRAAKLKISCEKEDVFVSGENFRRIIGYNTLKSTLFTIKSIPGKEYVEENIFYPNDEVYVLGSDHQVYPSKLSQVIISDGNNSYIFETELIKVVGVEIIPKTFIFEGRGWGHGVGMSQWGAKTLAEYGYNYRQILNFYYPGTYIEKIY